MEIHSIYEKGSGSINEDSLVLNNPIFCVCDGASGLERYIDDQGRSGALIASSLVAERIGKTSPYNTLSASVIDANWKLMKEMVAAGIKISDKIALWATTAAAVRLQKNIFEWVQIGDSLIMVIFKDYSYRLLVKDYDHDIETMKLWRKFAEEKRENIREIIEPFDLEVTKRRNIDYGVIDGELEVSSFVKLGTEKLDNVAHLILFTDGLIIPKENPEDPDDFDLFVKLFNYRGLRSIRNYVRCIEENDPDCWKYPRFKQHDDIAAISISF